MLQYFGKLCRFSTENSLPVRNLKIGICYRITQILILAYILVYDLYYHKSYQKNDKPLSTLRTAVQGLGLLQRDLNASIVNSIPDYLKNDFQSSFITTRVMLDTADFILPQNQPYQIFIMTNFRLNVQSQDFCENKKIKNSDNYNFINWCPYDNKIERRIDENLIRNSLNHTVFVENQVEFKNFKKIERNISPKMTIETLNSCVYDPIKNPYCPNFSLYDILNQAEPDLKEQFQMLLKGGIIEFEIIWNCNYDLEDSCKPKYRFRRFDTAFSDKSASSGFNFRFANKYRVSDKEYRNLVKAYGLKICMSVSGSAGRFDIIPLMQSIGSGIGLMIFSVLISDFLVMYFDKRKSIHDQTDLNFRIKSEEITKFDGFNKIVTVRI